MRVKCNHCLKSFYEEELKLHTPSGYTVCDDCLKLFLDMDEEVANPSVDRDANGNPVEQYWLSWRLLPVFHYTNGKSDFEIYAPDNGEGRIRPNTTVEELRKEIDEMEPETTRESEPDMMGPNQAERDEQHFSYQNLK